MAAALLAFTGCGSTTTENPPTTATDETGRVPPAPPPSKPGSGEAVVFAVDRLFLGETDRNGTQSGEAWKQYGFNLDGKISDATSKDLCKPVGTATASSVYTDGSDGIDNSFGKNI
ncbi:MAG TPA: hypothetical protein VLS89_04935, partial [Candidatus Nanopelagicales bacterium]|nr:hypothetical protein [Candidatus Nanopelagicales bacterium]